MALTAKMKVMGVPCDAAYIRISKQPSGIGPGGGDGGNAISAGRARASAGFQIIFSKEAANPPRRYREEPIPAHEQVEGGPTTREIALPSDPAPVLSTFHVGIDADDGYDMNGDLWAQLYAAAKVVLAEQMGATDIADDL